MTRAALRKPQRDLFAPGPAAAMRVQPKAAAVNELFLHPCAAPGCGAWGAFGVGVFRGVAGQWWCMHHRPAEAPRA